MNTDTLSLPRQATRADIRGIQRVRHAVRENRLITRVIGDDEVIAAIETGGRGWVVEHAGEVVGFAIGMRDGNIWALFVDPDHDRSGHGRRLHDVMLEWLWSIGLDRLWLSTDPGTRAEAFYRRAGWREAGRMGNEVRFEMERP